MDELQFPLQVEDLPFPREAENISGPGDEVGYRLTIRGDFVAAEEALQLDHGVKDIIIICNHHICVGGSFQCQFKGTDALDAGNW